MASGIYHIINTITLDYYWTGNDPKLFPDSIREKLRQRSGERNGFFGKCHSEETKQKLRLSRLGKSPSNKGISPTTEQREKQKNAIQNRLDKQNTK